MKRSFLFLQGPHGPFFRRLGDRLRALGHDVARVNLCGGDVVDWPTRQAVLFRDTSDAWAEWVADFARQRQVTDLVLYGDCRPLHRMAIDRLRPAGTRVHVFEEGYLRPNWITCEPDGVNGYSRFAMHMNPDSGPSSAPAGGFDAPLPLRPRPWVRAGYCLRHCAGNVVFAPMLPHYRTHRPLPLSREAIGWVKRGVRLRLNGRRMQQRLEHLCDGTQPVFLLLLQLDTDTQIQVHSPFNGMTEVIGLVGRSFAGHAPADATLIVKSHPFDNGVTDYGRVVAATGRTLGLSDRLVQADGGHLPSLLKRAAGVVIVNSTAGLQAIHHGCPTKLLGTAVYDHPALVDPRPLNDFWRSPMQPDAEVYRRFRAALLAYCQFAGSFFSAEGMAALLPAVTQRLAGDAVSEPLIPAVPEPTHWPCTWPEWGAMSSAAALLPADDTVFGRITPASSA